MSLPQIRTFSEEIAEARAIERGDLIESMAIAFHATDKNIRKVVNELRGSLANDAIVIPSSM